MKAAARCPIAGYGVVEGERFSLTGLVAEVDGTTVIKDRRSGPVGSAERIGIELAETLLARGAAGILDKLRAAGI